MGGERHPDGTRTIPATALDLASFPDAQRQLAVSRRPCSAIATCGVTDCSSLPSMEPATACSRMHRESHQCGLCRQADR